MRRIIRIVSDLRPGQSMRVQAELAPGLHDAALVVYLRHYNTEYWLPYIPQPRPNPQGAPAVQSILYFGLSDADNANQSAAFSIPAPEHCDFALVQDCDYADDPNIILKVKADGTIIQKSRRCLRNAERQLRAHYAALKDRFRRCPLF